jgi:molybdenum cofactor biosynthesis enzyme MoaA
MHSHEYRKLQEASGYAASPKLTVREAAAYLRVSKSLLDKLRLTGGGPVFIRLQRRIVYDIRDLEAWAAQGRRANTSEVA